MKRIITILVSLTILAALALSLSGGLIASLRGSGQELPTSFVTPAQIAESNAAQSLVIVDTPPWMAATSTPAPLPPPSSQLDLPRHLLMGVLVLLGVTLLIWLMTRSIRSGLKRQQQAALQRQPPPNPPLIERVRPAGARSDLPATPPDLSIEPEVLLQSEGLSDQRAAGIQQVRQGQLDAGIQTLVPVVQQQAQDAEAWLWLGLAYIGKKEWATAERCLRLAEKLGHPQAAQALGMVTKLSAQ